ncbi:hypothetical protein JHK87_001026 [Glycine soja]|nr:hypothetical protein JHK87_001026 [Glycine soja]
MFGSGIGSNSSNANTGTAKTTSATTSLGLRLRSKNAPRNKTDIGWKHRTNVLGNDSEPCPLVSEEVKMLMMKVVAEVANALEKKTKLNNIHEEGIHIEGIETNTTQRKEKFVHTSGEGVQANLNQLYEKGDKDKVDDQFAEFWYPSVIPFDVIKNLAFAKFSDMVARYGVGYMVSPYKPLSYHDIIEMLLKRAVGKTDLMLQEFRDEWKRTSCITLSDGWTDKKYIQFKGRRISTYIYGKIMLISIMKKFTNGRDLIKPSMHRFSMTYLTLSCLHELKASLMNMFSSEEWKTSKMGLWKNVTMCLKVVAPFMMVLRLADLDVKPTMGFIYEEMENAKEKIKCNFNNIKKSYEPVCKIIDERWDHQLHRPLHEAAYYLNPHLHYKPSLRHDGLQVKEGLHMCMRRLVKDVAKWKKINLQLDIRKVMQLGEWREMFGDGTPKLRRFVIHVLSLTCSSFEMLKSKQNRKIIALPFDEIEYDDEWITKDENNDEDEQPQVGDVGGSSNNPVVEAFDLDNLILVEPNDDAQSKEDLDDDGDGDETDDIHRNDPIRGLDMVL